MANRPKRNPPTHRKVQQAEADSTVIRDRPIRKCRHTNSTRAEVKRKQTSDSPTHILSRSTSRGKGEKCILGGLHKQKKRMKDTNGKLLMRDWIEMKLESEKYPGLRWISKRDRTFKISWKHASRHGWDEGKDACLFRDWAIHTRKYKKDGDDPQPKRWKANFRCAINSLKDIDELKNETKKKGHQAFRVYQMKDRVPHRRQSQFLTEDVKKERTSKWVEQTNNYQTIVQPKIEKIETTSNARLCFDIKSNHVGTKNILWNNTKNSSSRSEMPYQINDFFTENAIPVENEITLSPLSLDEQQHPGDDHSYAMPVYPMHMEQESPSTPTGSSLSFLESELTEEDYQVAEMVSNWEVESFQNMSPVHEHQVEFPIPTPNLNVQIPNFEQLIKSN